MTDSLCAVILAAGQGTRMKSNLPKVLHRVLGRTLVGHAVGAARTAGASRVLVIVGHGKDQVQEVLAAEEGADLEYVVQAEQLGTAHAVRQCEAALREHEGWTLILSGDVPGMTAHTLTDMVKTGVAAGTPLTFMSCVLDDATGYGRIERDAQGNVLRNVEHRDCDEGQLTIREMNVGTYLVRNDFLWKHLGNVGSTNDQSEYYLPDLVALSREAGGVTAYVVGDPQEVEGVNTRAQLAFAERVARQRRNHALMVSGVTMIDPDTTYVDAFVEVGMDVVLEPGVRLMGRTRIAGGVVVRQGSIVEDSEIEADVVIKPYSHIESSVVRVGAQIGPFAHLRPKADIGPGAKVGNFVEIKKSTLGPGAKASHLSYLGDAIIGADCNIGAGTITCNYDGVNKHQTILGDGVFTGSNSALVAPIEVGDRAYIGAGSTVTSNIEAGALAVARGRQRNIPGWTGRAFPKKK
jgi:bifunctional UDP-N-acetylglucosamine pyrophosphorylase / glucosamine-1-phosphate N-acetyltransferase